MTYMQITILFIKPVVILRPVDLGSCP